jgi:hypothetical protein
MAFQMGKWETPTAHQLADRTTCPPEQWEKPTVHSTV